MVRNLLENAGIESVLKNEPTVPYGGPGRRKRIVSDPDYDRARSIVAEYDRSRREAGQPQQGE